MQEHTQTYHILLPTHQCFKCLMIFSNLTLLEDHKKTTHRNLLTLTCNECVFTALDRAIFNSHIMQYNSGNSLTIDNNDSVVLVNDFNEHIPLYKSDECDNINENLTYGLESSFEESSCSENLGQLDGNISDLDPAIICSTVPDNTRQSNLTYNYLVNEQNQARRLIENVSRDPLNIIYNNIQVIEGREIPTNATIRCNPGVYISAVKPALQSVHEGWRKEVLDAIMTCTSVSDRNDSSKREVCTQIVLNISDKHDRFLQQRL